MSSTAASNYVAATAAANPAYVLFASGGNGRRCSIEHAGGLTTRQGLWGDGRHQLEILAFNEVLTLDCQFSDTFVIAATDARKFTIDSPLNPAYGKRITITIKNATGAALGPCVWQPIYRMSSLDSPRSGQFRSIEFMYDGTHWLEVARTAHDITI